MRPPRPVSCVAARKIADVSLGTHPRYSLVVDENVKKPNNKQLKFPLMSTTSIFTRNLKIRLAESTHPFLRSDFSSACYVMHQTLHNMNRKCPCESGLVCLGTGVFAAHQGEVGKVKVKLSSHYIVGGFIWKPFFFAKLTFNITFINFSDRFLIGLHSL